MPRPALEDGLTEQARYRAAISVVWRSKCGPVIGRLRPEEMAEVDASLALVFALAR